MDVSCAYDCCYRQMIYAMEFSEVTVVVAAFAHDWYLEKVLMSQWAFHSTEVHPAKTLHLSE